MPSPADGNVHRDFSELMRLEKIDSATYRSITRPYCPGGIHPKAIGRTYGGHVYAQAAWAASRTVGEGYILHNISGFFILGGLSDIPFVYRVQEVRDGRSYKTRTVTVTQEEGKGICFTAICSFKTSESSELDVQEPADLWKRYKAVLDGKRPEDFPIPPSMDVPWYKKALAEGAIQNEKFPGLEVRKPEMQAYNDSLTPLDKRMLTFYKPVGSLSSMNMEICAHLYASDRSGLYIVAGYHDVGDTYSQIGSISHTVLLHAPMEELAFRSTDTENSFQGDWFCREDHSDRATGGRVTFHARIWSPNGTHVATILQDGMVRVGKKPHFERTAAKL
jgi:acyl-CoA thioesterase II